MGILKDLFSRRKDSAKAIRLSSCERQEYIQKMLDAGCKIPISHICEGLNRADTVIVLASFYKTKMKIDTTPFHNKALTLYFIPDNIRADITNIPNVFYEKTGEFKLETAFIWRGDIRRIIEEREGNIDLVKNFYHGDLCDFAEFLGKTCEGFDRNTTFCNAQADALLDLYAPEQLKEKLDKEYRKIFETLGKMQQHIGCLTNGSTYLRWQNTQRTYKFLSALCSTTERKLRTLKELEHKVHTWKP